MASPLYYVADALDMALHISGREAEGRATRELYFGPFSDAIEMMAYSDVIDGKDAGFFISLGKRLWLYLHVGPYDSRLYVVDGAIAGLTAANVHTFGGKNPIKTVDDLRWVKAIKAGFVYRTAEQGWLKLQLIAEMK